ncbi:hypothetical protein L195_g057750 [Trifolium pratense]|uniref:Uncharacterized protein n=1 Tax=Trifolium pratense TaxID=57577 RepID=A0A2K3KX06_TRIPR|nr:hypothetical protein L195_g057750 [Trifolium pratense]
MEISSVASRENEETAVHIESNGVRTPVVFMWEQTVCKYEGEGHGISKACCRTVFAEGSEVDNID